MKLRKKIICGGVIIYILLCILVSKFICINTTKSEPLGVYLKYTTNAYNVGDLVLLCVDDDQYIQVMKRLGLSVTNNECQHNTPFLLKQIVAKVGDVVNIGMDGITINGVHYKYSQALISYNNIALLPQLHKHFILKENQFMLLGKTPHSYDSRYFGVVNLHQIKYKVKPLITFNNYSTVIASLDLSKRGNPP